MNEEEKELVEGIKKYPTSRELMLISVIERLDDVLDKKNKLLNKVIKKVPIEKFDGTKVTEETLLEDLDIFFDEWERLEDKEDELFELSALNFIKKTIIKEKIKNLKDMLKELSNEYIEGYIDTLAVDRITYKIDVLEELLKENER